MPGDQSYPNKVFNFDSSNQQKQNLEINFQYVPLGKAGFKEMFGNGVECGTGGILGSFTLTCRSLFNFVQRIVSKHIYFAQFQSKIWPLVGPACLVGNGLLC